jgi:hypothetical protein
VKAATVRHERGPYGHWPGVGLLLVSAMLRRASTATPGSGRVGRRSHFGGGAGNGRMQPRIMVTGDGMDVNVTPHIGICAIEADYYLTRFPNGVNTRQNNFRISAGFLFRSRSGDGSPNPSGWAGFCRACGA